MKIEQIALEKLIPYSFNNKKHTITQVNHIANSIKEFGFNQPIVIDEDNVILVGHGRLEAAQKLGLQTVPVYQHIGLTETQKKAYRILDNKLAGDAEWDFDNIKVEFDFLEEQNFPFEDFGLEFDFLNEEPVVEVSEDDFDGALPKESYIRRGDLIELGRHRVLCGDNLELKNLNALMQGEKTALLLTDPPYNVAQDTNLYGQDLSKSLKSLSNSDWDFDFSPKAFLNTIKEFLKGDSWLYVFTSHALFGEIVDWMNRERGHASFCVWCKPNPMPSLAKNVWTFAVELCPFSKLGKPVFNYPHGEHCLNWWNIAKKSDGTHPTQKTIEVIGNIINRCSTMGDMVLDPFLGSGTTLIAADQLNRTCYGMELEPVYCQVIIERYKKYCIDNNKKFECTINGTAFDGETGAEKIKADTRAVHY